jgi:hypothetical protein
MDFRFANLKWLPVAVALSAAVLPAAAQNGAAPAGQAILFSTPTGDTAASNATALASPDSRSQDLANRFQSPESLFNTAPPDQFSLPSGSPAISGSQARRLQKNAEDQKNWALLTPEEILGVTSPEEILASDTQDKEHKSPSERFLARQQTGATNSFFNDNQASRWILSKDRDDANATGSARPGLPDAAQFLNRFGAALPDNNPFASQNQDDWFKQQATAFPKPNPEQIAAMGRFRQLLNSGSSADALEKSSGSKFLSSQEPPLDPNLETLPVVNRFGASYMPLSSSFNKPTGLTPLPGTTQPMVTPVVTPSWAPKPPPWLTDNPPRKF